MAINLDCPRCKTRLRVPNKKADGYVNCPQCQGRFWVDKAAQSDALPVETVTTAVPPPVAPPAPPTYVATEAAAPANIPPREAISPTALPVSAAVGPLAPSKPNKVKSPVAAANSAPPAPPAAPPIVKNSGRKVARFISAEAAQSSLQLAADGKLPELHLSDGSQKVEKEKKTSSLSPLALIGIVALSVIFSVGIVVLSDSSSTGNVEERAKAWATIEANYFSDPAGGELKPYNRLLREAKRAHQAQDGKTQRELFGKVLDLIRAERSMNERGLTGSRQRDKTLEKNITILMNGLK